MAYKIVFSNGDAPITVDGALNITPTLAAKYGYAPVLERFEDRYLFWESEDDAMDDIGACALGSVYWEVV
jgi:hypothetical protein